ncbi:MAG: extracellular solute-binding protein [Bacteroides sp.]|nr:extracellular solute-binding protein [Eubacterium sp.]MCM1418716.1 extracellular solute-binding protein [Roseburia sp.]MCM1462783.1 extracellular solute-binding protein [Bacteroides sp.]
MNKTFKKTLSLALAALTTLFALSACSPQEDNVPDVTATPENKVAQALIETDNFSSFDISGDTVYVASSYQSENESADPTYESKITVFDGDGVPTEEYVFDEGLAPRNLTLADDGSFYYTVPRLFEDLTEKHVVMRYQKNEKSAEQLLVLDDCTDVKKVEIVGDTLFLLGLYPRPLIQTANETYRDNGEQLMRVDLKTLEISPLVPSGVLDFSKSVSGALLIYACDDVGYYFMTYDPAEDRLSEKVYKDLGTPEGICAYDDEKFVAYSLNIASGAVIGSLSSEGMLPLFDEDTRVWGRCRISNGKFYNLANEGVWITDISSLLSKRLDSAIRIVMGEYNSHTPSASGFAVEEMIIDYDQFALTVLSLDKNYDIFLTDSRQDFAAQIRDKGAFYPLNEVEGVSEYLDACFPYIKEAATNADGDVWMLPITNEATYMIYNEAICRDAGIDFSEGMNAEEFVDLVLSEYQKGNTNYEISSDYHYYEKLLSDYIIEYGRFDTPEFRDLASLIKDKIVRNADAFWTASVFWESGDRTEESFSLEGGDGLLHLYERDMKDNARAVDTPTFTGSGKNIVSVVFLCINPYSENLDQTLAFVSAYAKNALSKRDVTNEVCENMMFADSSIYDKNRLYRDLHRIQENSVIRFAYPYEIYGTDFEDYLDDKITLDEFIKEADRKLSAYLNE